MWWKNFMVSRKKLKNVVIYERFKLYTKQCYGIVSNVEEIQKMKTKKF